MFNEELTISKLVTTTGGRRIYQQSQAVYGCYIEPIDTETAQVGGYALENTFIAYMRDYKTSMSIADKVTDREGTEYTVKGIKFYNAGSVSHAVAVIEGDPTTTGIRADKRVTSFGDIRVTSFGTRRVTT